MLSIYEQQSSADTTVNKNNNKATKHIQYTVLTIINLFFFNYFCWRFPIISEYLKVNYNADDKNNNNSNGNNNNHNGNNNINDNK